MPTLRGVTVQVAIDKTPLKEWGTCVQQNKVSCYIESETNKSFQILLKPEIPYVTEGEPAAHEHKIRCLEKENPGVFNMEGKMEDVGSDKGY